jgi:hypothetical protein
MSAPNASSESTVQELGDDVRRSVKPRVILSLNDYDPSGSIMLADIIDRAKHYVPISAVFISEQITLTREQVIRYKLPTRSTKTEGNAHAPRFSNPDSDSVELDALDPMVLRGLFQVAIERRVDKHALALMQEAEQSKRANLHQMAEVLA